MPHYTINECRAQNDSGSKIKLGICFSLMWYHLFIPSNKFTQTRPSSLNKTWPIHYLSNVVDFEQIVVGLLDDVSDGVELLLVHMTTNQLVWVFFNWLLIILTDLASSSAFCLYCCLASVSKSPNMTLIIKIEKMLANKEIRN